MAPTAPGSAAALHQNHFLFTFQSKNTINSLLFNSHNCKSSLLFSPTTKPLLNSLSSSIFSSPPCFHITRVTTVPVEYAPPAPGFDLNKEIARLKTIRSHLSHSLNLRDKIRTIDRDPRVKNFFNSHKNGVSKVLESLDLDEFQLFLLKCVVAAGQEHVLGSGSNSVDSVGEFDFSARSSLKSALYALADIIENWDASEDFGKKGFEVRFGDEEMKALRSLLKNLEDIEQFYNCIGGIIGYQMMVLELLAQSTYEGQSLNFSHHVPKSTESQILEIHPPNVLDLSEDTEYASQAALWGIEGLPDLGEIYPLGGSADRLGLIDPNTGECLPAAMLPYCGRTLLEGLIRDLQAREFLYFKLYGKQCISPVAIMTSSAKNNHKHITSLCENLRWFGRGRSSFKLFEQVQYGTL